MLRHLVTEGVRLLYLLHPLVLGLGDDAGEESLGAGRAVDGSLDLGVSFIRILRVDPDDIGHDPDSDSENDGDELGCLFPTEFERAKGSRDFGVGVVVGVFHINAPARMVTACQPGSDLDTSPRQKQWG